MGSNMSMVGQALSNLKGTFGLGGAASSSGPSMADYQMANMIQQMPAKHEQKVKEEEAEDRAKVNTNAVQPGGRSAQRQMGM